ncbi:MAG: sugar ABC transporter permease [Clostridia bacterium]|nr:sugar ABC transporter permease [Clostridia bacterium]
MAKKNPSDLAGSARRSWKTEFRRDWVVYLLFVPIIVYEVVLHYLPMFGIVMAFEDYNVIDGYFRSPWVGFKHFIDLFSGEDFPIAIRNTVAIGLIRCTFGFVAPILFALMLSLINSKKFKRVAQTMSYMPNFVAAVIVCSLFTQFLSKDGPLTMLLTKVFGAENQNWFANDQIPVFWIIYTLMGIWQSIGWGSIMYVAAISQVSGDLHEAAALDGASRLQRMWKITIPSILPMVLMMFVINVGTALAAGYDNILLLYMPSTYNVSDTVYTYTYRQAFGGGTTNYSLSAASGLFQSVVSTILLVGSNALSRKAAGSSLF